MRGAVREVRELERKKKKLTGTSILSPSLSSLLTFAETCNVAASAWEYLLGVALVAFFLRFLRLFATLCFVYFLFAFLHFLPFRFVQENQKNPRVHKMFVRNSVAGNGCANFMDAWKTCVRSAGKPYP